MPEAAACVSVGELRAADGLFEPRELRAIKIWDGLVDIVVVVGDESGCGHHRAVLAELI